MTGVLTLTVIALLVTGLTVKVRARHSEQAEVDLLAIARKVELPPGSKPYTQAGTSCWPTSFVRCAQIDTDADTAARQMQALVSVAADEEAGLVCETAGSPRVRSRMCTIRIDRDRRVLFVEVTSKLRLVDGKITLDGSEIRIAKP